jgi:hypothetical protein
MDGKETSSGPSDMVDTSPLPPNGVKFPFRRCDYWASQLSQVDGFPFFELFWPQERRDATIANMITFLSQYGQCYSYAAAQSLVNSDWHLFYHTRMIFLARQKPATAQDVANGTAIFSLTVPARVVPFNSFPQKVNWTTLKDYPRTEETTDEKTGRLITVTTYDQSALAWQAEEVLENGQWHRYYGLVGPHGIAEVPAEEIEIDKPGTN